MRSRSALLHDRYRIREIINDETRLTRFYQFMDPASLVAGGRIAPHWMRDGSSFWYAHGSHHDTVILRVDGETGNAAPLFDVTATRKALGALLGCDTPYKGLPFDTFVELADGRYRFAFGGI